MLEVIDSGAARSYGWRATAVETLFILLLFFLIAGSPPPGVGESHYLPKAKHYWDPAWCRGDLFLESADAHLTFYWCLGWVTKFLSLEATAWLGRSLTWLLLAWSWQRLSVALVPRPLFSILSSGLLLVFTRWFHLAGEWVIGGIEAKSFAYVFFFLALECLARRRWTPAWLWMGTAAAFHVLIGGWGCVLLGGVWLLEICFGKQKKETPRLSRMWPAVVGGFLLSLPGLIPAVLLNRGVQSDVAREAATAYVFERLGHHLVFHCFEHWFMARHLMLLTAWAALAWRQRRDVRLRALHLFTLGAVLVGVCGAIIDQTLLEHRELAAKLLRYYWFRLSDTMLAAAAAIALVQEIARRQQSRPQLFGLLLFAGILMVGIDVTLTLKQRSELRLPGAFLQPKPTQPPASTEVQRPKISLPELFKHWQDVCAWIERETPADARFLTPRRQQTFKWYAQRSEVVNWKDVPQDAAGLARWKEAMDEIYPRSTFEDDLAAHSDEQLFAIAQKYNAQYLVLDRTRARRSLKLERVYPAVRSQNPAYEVYRVPAATGAEK